MHTYMASGGIKLSFSLIPSLNLDFWRRRMRGREQGERRGERKRRGRRRRRERNRKKWG